MKPKNGYFHQWTEDEVQFLKDTYPHHTRKETARLFNEHFGLNLTVDSITAKSKHLKIKRGESGRFKKGRTPWNKGMIMPPEVRAKCKLTMFRKGTQPHNTRKIGSTRISKDGYVEIKISDQHRGWESLHKLVMQSMLGRKLEKNEMVRFKDGNRTNCNPDNLILTTRAVNARVNSRKDNFSNKAIESVIALETVKCKIRDLEKGGNK